MSQANLKTKLDNDTRSTEKNILVVDDNEHCLNLIDCYLEDQSFKITKAKNGKDAFKKFSENKYDLVITDIMMPEDDGIGLMMKIKKSKIQTKVLAVSGGGMNVEQNFSLLIAGKLGASGCLAKPFSPNELIEMIDLILEM